MDKTHSTRNWTKESLDFWKNPNPPWWVFFGAHKVLKMRVWTPQEGGPGGKAIPKPWIRAPEGVPKHPFHFGFGSQRK